MAGVELSQPPPSGDRLAANLLHFVRLLRRLGFAVGTTHVADLLRGLSLVDIADRSDFYYVTHACVVTSPDQRELFDRAFERFWLGRERWLLELGAAEYLRPAPPVQRPIQTRRSVSRDRADDRYQPPDDGGDRVQEREISAVYSALEVLHHKDFAAMTEDELAMARRAIAAMVWEMGTRLTRRRVRASKRTCCPDLPRTVRNSIRFQGEMMQLAWRRRRIKPRPLVAICDISGSMERYSRLLLHFMYAMQQSSKYVETFVFGTRLTRITPALRHRQVESALREVSREVLDWSGGTRIGESLKAFNFRYGRRVLRSGAAVVIISDGWERGDIELLGREMARLQRSCHQLIWLNPLAGAPDYAPLVQGMQAALPHIDLFLPLHNLDSMQQLLSHLRGLPVSEGGRHFHTWVAQANA
jgi:uncharacterized protein with von Willebrand factor type A (vWA) domain